MTDARHSRRDLLKILGAAPIVAGAAMSRSASVPAETQAQSPAQGAAPARPSFSLWSLTLQWTGDMDEACAVAAEAGYTSIAWTVRPGAHILAENVARDLPKAVAAARKAGLSTPMVVTPIVDATSPRAEAILDAMHSVGIRYYRGNTLGRYDYTKDLAPQLEAVKPRIASLVKLNEKYGTTVMYNNESSGGLIGAGIWDLWMALKDFDPAQAGISYNLAHATMRGGPEWWETIRFAHAYVVGVSLCDFKWVRKTDPVRGPRRTDTDTGWSWAAEWVAPGEGMVNFKSAFESLKLIGFSGPIHVFYEYFVDVPGVTAPVNLLGAAIGSYKLEMPRAQYVSYLRRDQEFYSRLMTKAGLV
jgi:L-ribulose-5-phosphate 3-epimerase